MVKSTTCVQVWKIGIKSSKTVSKFITWIWILDKADEELGKLFLMKFIVKLMQLHKFSAEIEARLWTCAFIGEKGCNVKCFAMGRRGGYCNDKNTCVCVPW